MIDKQKIQAIKDKEMDRKDFLKYSGLVVVSLLGLKTVVNLLLSENKRGSSIFELDSKNKRTGFGGGRYGV